jgi:hypothetical protein
MLRLPATMIALTPSDLRDFFANRRREPPTQLLRTAYHPLSQTGLIGHELDTNLINPGNLSTRTVRGNEAPADSKSREKLPKIDQYSAAQVTPRRISDKSKAVDERALVV